MKNFEIHLISDSVNGLLEIHFEKNVAVEALESFIDEGNKINKEEGNPDKAEDFFCMETIEIASMDDLKKTYEEHGSSSGTFQLNILLEALEKGMISESEYLEAVE